MYFEFYTYIRVGDNGVLILNTLDGSKVLTSEERIVKLMYRYLNSMNSGGMEIDVDNEYSDTIYQSFFNEIRNNYLGDFIECGLYKQSPFQFPNTKKIVNDIRCLEVSYPVEYDLVVNSIFTINIYINSSCKFNCKNCSSYYKQFRFCKKSEYNESIDFRIIERMFKNNDFVNLKKINILGGDVSLYENLDILFENLRKYKDLCYVYFNILNYESVNDDIRNFFNNRIYVLVDFASFNKMSSFEFLDVINNVNIIFVTTNMNEFDVFNKFANDNGLVNYEFAPYYNGENYSFFENMVFIDKDDVFSDILSLKEIHKNQLINSYYFGELSIFSNGDVYNGNAICLLGNLYNLSFVNIIRNALCNTDSMWFMTRNKIEPCKNCVYVDLCPNISGYEFVINKFDLCKLY